MTWKMSALALTALVFLLLPARAAGQTPVTLNTQTAVGSSAPITVTFMPAHQLNLSYPNVNLGTPVTVTSTNGIATTNLLEGPYVITYAGYTASQKVYVPGLYCTNFGITLPVNLSDLRWQMGASTTVIQMTTGVTNGVNGQNGTSGTNGISPTITVGGTTTGAAGSAASVVNVGTSNAVVLQFTIPQGAAGSGSGGAGGISAVNTNNISTNNAVLDLDPGIVNQITNSAQLGAGSAVTFGAVNLGAWFLDGSNYNTGTGGYGSMWNGFTTLGTNILDPNGVSLRSGGSASAITNIVGILTNNTVGNSATSTLASNLVGIATASIVTNQPPVRVFYVSLTGNDATGKANSTNNPFSYNFTNASSVTHLATNTGDHIYLMAGTYNISNQINVAANTVFEGDSTGLTILVPTNNLYNNSQVSLFAIGNNVTLQNFTYQSVMATNVYGSFLFGQAYAFTNCYGKNLMMYCPADVFYNQSGFGNYWDFKLSDSVIVAPYDIIQFGNQGSQLNVNFTSEHNVYFANPSLTRLLIPVGSFNDFGSKFYNFGTNGNSSSSWLQGAANLHGSIFNNCYGLPFTNTLYPSSGSYIDQTSGNSYSFTPDGSMFLTNSVNAAAILSYDLTTIAITNAGTAAANQVYRLNSPQTNVIFSSSAAPLVWTNSVNGNVLVWNDQNNPDGTSVLSVENSSSNVLYDFFAIIPFSIASSVANGNLVSGSAPIPGVCFYTNKVVSKYIFYPAIFHGDVWDDGTNIGSSRTFTGTFTGNGGAMTNASGTSMNTLSSNSISGGTNSVVVSSTNVVINIPATGNFSINVGGVSAFSVSNGAPYWSGTNNAVQNQVMPNTSIIANSFTGNGFVSTATNTVFAASSTGFTNGAGDLILCGVTGVGITRTNILSGQGFSYGTLTTPTDIFLTKSNQLRATSGFSVLGFQSH